MKYRKIQLVYLFVLFIFILVLSTCSQSKLQDGSGTISVVDQLGRTIVVPQKITRIAALHHFGGKVVFALGQQDKVVDQALYHRENEAMAKVNPAFAAKPSMLNRHGINIEEMITLKPDVAFVYASFNKADIEQLENANIKVVAIRGETIKESYEGVKVMARVLHCEAKGQDYIDNCESLLNIVKKRMANLPIENRLQVVFAGPKNIYTVATGEMLQTEILNLAGAANVASNLKGFWATISPEQMATWNPDVIFLGSRLDTYGTGNLYNNLQFRTIKAIKSKRVYTFPSNIGWWDYPAPHCVLGVVWAAKTLYPERFTDLDMLKIADEFYTKYMGYSFTAMGGKLY
jgi:iron complex transport system substrate-binding protein